jgi:hypothetical protein
VTLQHQTHCTLTGVKHPDKKHKPVFLKELSKLWATFKPGEYGPSNCLLVDDSPYKALKNPPSTAIFPQTYTGHESDDNFLGGALRQYLEGLRDAEDVQAYVEKNPIGEPSITAASPLWQVYSGLIGAGQPESVNREANVASNSTLVGDGIIAHESSKKSRRSSPVCQLEEIYPDEKWSYSPRPVAEERLGKRLKHGWDREDDSHSGEQWGHSRRTVNNRKWDGVADCYSGERWSHSPRTVDDGKWGKQPKNERDRGANSYSGEKWGYSPRTVADERWGEQPKSVLDREVESAGWDHFNKQYAALNVPLQPREEQPNGEWDRVADGYSGEQRDHSATTVDDERWGEQPKREWDREVESAGWDHFNKQCSALNVPLPPQENQPKGEWDRVADGHSGEQWGYSPRTVDDKNWGGQPNSEWDREAENDGWDRFEEQYDVSLSSQGGSQIDREGSQVRWDRDYQHGESIHCKRSGKTGGCEHMEGHRESDASFVPPLPGGESLVDREGRLVRLDRVHQRDGEFYQRRRSVEARGGHQMDKRRDWDAPRGRSNWHGRGRSWGHYFEHGSGHWNRPSPPYWNGTHNTSVEWRCQREITGERRYEHYRGQYEQNANVKHAPSRQHSNRGRESWRIPANKDHADGGVIWGHPSVEEQDQEQDSWADFKVENRAGGGSWEVTSSADEIRHGWDNFSMENKASGGSWGGCSTEEQVQDGSNFTMENRGDGTSWGAPTVEDQVDGWANFATARFVPKHGWANESEQGPSGFKTNHYTYDSRPGTYFGGRNHHRHELRPSFATQNQGGHCWEGEHTYNSRAHSRHLSSENQRGGEGWEAHSGNDSSCASWPSPPQWNSTRESREPGRTRVSHGHR